MSKITAVTFTKEVEATFKKYFPNGYFYVGKYSLGNGGYFNAGLISNIKDVSSQIRANDNLSLSLDMHNNIKFGDDEIDLSSTKLTVEFSSSCVYTLPTNPMYAMQHLKIPARKMNNTPAKLLVALDKYFKNARDIVKEQIDNNMLYGQDRILSKYLEI